MDWAMLCSCILGCMSTMTTKFLNVGELAEHVKRHGQGGGGGWLSPFYCLCVRCVYGAPHQGLLFPRAHSQSTEFVRKKGKKKTLAGM